MVRETFCFGTKSETLERLQPHVRLCQILPLVYFTVKQWRQQPSFCLQQVAALGDKDGQLIIRSSAKNEDGLTGSMAGAFTSCLNVESNDLQAIIDAVNCVINSFTGHDDETNQVLVQPMLANIQMSGVIMTHDLQQGAPYYIINYDDESGLTDTITGGIGIQKTVLIYRDTDMSLLRSPRIRAVINACREVEVLCGNVPLDLEFAVDSQETVYLLQTRRISLYNTWHPVNERRVARQLSHVSHFLQSYLGPAIGVYGDRTILGVMPDWNPAEIIGSTPRPLASSLYRMLVTDSVWREARASMGYHHPLDQRLMLLLGHQPFIDVRLSFNSFLPGGIAPSVANKLVNAWLDRLDEHPHWHDKVEFEIAQTCHDFCFKNDFESRYRGILTEEELIEYQQLLSVLTKTAIEGSGTASLASAIANIEQLTKFQNHRNIKSLNCDLTAVGTLLQRCRRSGTNAFSILARHAFIAESLLRSACRREAISASRLQEFKQSIHTVSTNLIQDYSAVIKGNMATDVFLGTFGHLRPGTYDITSLRYDERSDLFDCASESFETEVEITEEFIWSEQELSAIQQLITECGWSMSASQLLQYAANAIQAREHGKFVFTKDLSDALAMLTQWGNTVGLSREDLSFLNIDTLLNSLTEPLLDDIDRIWLQQANQASIEYKQAGLLKLAHLISSADDVFVVPLHRAMANYITQSKVEASVYVLEKNSPIATDLKGKIVCIENADPGYDWVFTRGIAGLVTQFGGTNSHMAIRCAELGVPAAIGCAEQAFSRLRCAKRAVLNCAAQTLDLV